MLIFKCCFSAREMEEIRSALPGDGYCVVSNAGDRMCYGAINDEIYNQFMDVLSGETLEQLEYLDEDEFRRVLKGFSSPVFVGNRALVEEFE